MYERSKSLDENWMDQNGSEWRLHRWIKTGSLCSLWLGEVSRPSPFDWSPSLLGSASVSASVSASRRIFTTAAWRQVRFKRMRPVKAPASSWSLLTLSYPMELLGHNVNQGKSPASCAFRDWLIWSTQDLGSHMISQKPPLLIP